MKLKLKQDELHALMSLIKSCEQVSFNTNLESKICGSLLKDFVLKLAKKAVEGTPKISVSLDNATMHALNFVMPQLISEDSYSLAIRVDIHQQINKACLSI